MKRSIIRRLLTPVVLVGLCLCAQTADALDAPHNNLDKNELISCSSCHYNAASPPAWATSATLTGDTTKFNNLCISCHSTGNLPHGAQYEDIATHSSTAVESNKYGEWTVECRVCHAPHYQQQVLSYTTDTTSYLRTGTVNVLTTGASLTLTSITDNAANFTPGEWVGYLLIPNTAYPTTMYRIQGNTAKVITVYGALNPYYAAINKTYSIQYGKMVKQKITTRNSGVRQVKMFNDTGLNSLGSGTTAATTAVCQVCHTYTTSFNNSGVQEAGAHPLGVVALNQPCKECHTHATGFKAGGCTNCHGSPPIDNATLIFKDINETTVTSDSPGAGAHVKHTQSAGYGCDNCHDGGMLSGKQQGDFKINLGFKLGETKLGGNYDGKNNRSFYTYASGTNSPTTVTDTGTLQCSNLYCHSTVQTTTGGPLTGLPGEYKTPAWTGAGTVVCGSCHKADGAQGDLSKMDSGGHTAHLTTTVGATCATCHSSATHANRNIDVTSAFSYSMGGTPGNGYGSCSAASCHMSAYADIMVMTPTWGNAAGCSACHTVEIEATGPATGGHAAHGYTDCTLCHNDGTTAISKPTTSHADGDIDIANVGYPANKAKGSAYTTCSTASCHGSSSPVWGANTTNNTCTKCHGTPTVTVDGGNRYVVAPPKSVAGVLSDSTDIGQVSSDSKIGAHQTHLLYLNGLRSTATDTIDDRCGYCHGTLPTSGMHANSSSTPTFQGLATNSGAMTATYTGTTCNNTYCHNPAGTGGTLLAANVGSNTTPTWTNAAYIADGTLKTQDNCKVCHKVPGDIGFEPATTHNDMTIAGTDCVGCHGHNGGPGGIVGQRHMDGAMWGAGQCDTCHDYDTVSGDWGKSILAVEGWGAHAKHIDHLKTLSGTVLTAATDTFGGAAYNAVCGVCHTKTAGNHDMGGTPNVRTINFGDNAVTHRLNNTAAAVYSGTSGSSSADAAKTCSNVSCHFQATPVWQGY